MAKSARIHKTGRTKAAVDGAVADANKKSVAKAGEVKKEKQKVGKINFGKQKLGKMLEALIAGDSDRAAEELHSYLEEKTRDLMLGEKKDDKDMPDFIKDKMKDKDDDKDSDDDDDDKDSDDDDDEDDDDKDDKKKK